MHLRNSCRILAGPAAVFALVLSLSREPSLCRPAVRADDGRAAKPLTADLVAAIRNGDAAGVGKALAAGADVNARDASGNTPLILASFYANTACVDLLIGRGADVNAVNKAGATALIRAATSYPKASLLVAAGADVKARTTGLGNTPLLLAARRAGNSRTVQLLLARGASATEGNRAGVTPLLAAAASGDVEAVRLLLDAGARPDSAPSADAARPADMTAGFRTPLMWAANQNDVPTVRLLLDRGADPNLSTAYGTPLSHACWTDAFDSAELLLAAGAAVDARDALANFTPLHWAAATEAPSPRLVKLLLARGANPNAAGGEPIAAFGLVPQTPRLIAQRRGPTAVVDALMAAGANDSPRALANGTPRRALPDRLDTATVVASAEKARRCRRPRPGRVSRSSGTSASKTAPPATSSICRWPPWATPATGPSASTTPPLASRSTPSPT